MDIRRNYTSIKFETEDKEKSRPLRSSGPEESAKPEIFKRHGSAPEMGKEKSISLEYRKANEVKTEKTDMTLRVLKGFIRGEETTGDTEEEIRHFWKQAIGGRAGDIDKIPEDGLRAMSAFLLEANDIGLIKSVLEKVKPDEAGKVFELLKANPVLWKVGQLNTEVLNTMLASENPIGTMEALLGSPNLLNLSKAEAGVELLNTILALENPIEIIKSLDQWKDFSGEGLNVLKKVLISGTLELFNKHPELYELSSAEVQGILNSSNHYEMMSAMDKAVRGGMDMSVIQAALQTEDPLGTLTRLLEAPDMWKDKSAEDLSYINEMIKGGSFQPIKNQIDEYRNVMLPQLERDINSLTKGEGKEKALKELNEVKNEVARLEKFVNPLKGSQEIASQRMDNVSAAMSFSWIGGLASGLRGSEDPLTSKELLKQWMDKMPKGRYEDVVHDDIMAGEEGWDEDYSDKDTKTNREGPAEV